MKSKDSNLVIDSQDGDRRMAMTGIQLASAAEAERERTVSGTKALFAKRCFDIFGSALGLITLSPIMLATMLAIRLESVGPAIFCQERIGHGGSVFKFYKFRSMQAGCDSAVHKQYVRSLIQGGKKNDQVNKMTDDKRVTRVGKFIRRASLDELPQLWNVFIGNMSLVGPRPALPYEVEAYEGWHMKRFATPPGMTGLWQVSGRSERTFDEMVQLDLEYIHEWTLWRDIRILWRTIPAVLGKKGAL